MSTLVDRPGSKKPIPDIDVQGSFLETPARLGNALAEVLPEAHARLEDCLTELPIFLRGYLSIPRNQHAAATVSNQAFNDFIDLCYDLLACRGRPALRAARALFEHLVNYLDVTSDLQASRRYEAHAAVAAQIEAEAAIGLDRLNGAKAKAERHRLRKLGRDSRVEYDSAIALYSSGFKARWAETNLRERAGRYQFEREYDFYRLASMVLHGSVGGAKGTLSSAYERPVHRTGPALALCPPAYLKGLTYFRLLIEHAGTVTPEVASKPLIDAVARALVLWPEYQDVITNIDRRTWPERAPEGPQAILAISRGDRRRWYLHDPAVGLVVRADPPSRSGLTQRQQAAIEQVVADLPPGDERADDWITIACFGVRLNPKPSARWIPESAILVSKDSGRIFEKPRVIELRDQSTEQP